MARRRGDAVGHGVEVSIKASGLRNMDYYSLSDPFVILSTPGVAKPGASPPDADEVLGQTETCWDTLAPHFIKTVTLGANTSRELPLTITAYDRDSEKEVLAKHDLLGTATTTLRAVLDAGVDGLSLPLSLSSDAPPAPDGTSLGAVTLMAETIEDAAPTHDLAFEVEPLPPRLSGDKPFLLVSRRRGDNSWQPVHRTAVSASERRWPVRLRPKEGDPSAVDPAAPPRTATLRAVRGRGRLTETPLRFELWAHEKAKPNRLLGGAQLSLGSLRRQQPGKHLVLSHKGEVAAEVVFRAVAVQAADASAFELIVQMAA